MSKSGHNFNVLSISLSL